MRHFIYNIYCGAKRGGELSPRTGRPKIDNPKLIEVKARIDDKTYELLMKYCKENHKTKSDVVREGIELILGQKK